MYQYSGLSLSPMAGYSDWPFRSLCSENGSTISYSEFVNANLVVQRNEQTLKMLRFSEFERPVVFQLFGNHQSTLVEAALLLEELGPDGIDLNLGCSVPKVVDRGSGAALLNDTKKIGQIIAALVSRIKIPISAKIRLGWNDSNDAIMIAQTIQDNGASLISVHGRTAKQRYTGEADWPLISEIKAKLSIPVLGNGDIDSFATAKLRMSQSGVDGVLIGRAAQGNPWIFNEHDEEPEAVEVLQVMKTHLIRMIEFHGEVQGLLRFRKHALSYLKRLDANPEIYATLIEKTDLNQFLTQLDSIAALILDGKIMRIDLNTACL